MTNLSPYGQAVDPTVDDDLRRYGFCVLRDIISKTDIAERSITPSIRVLPPHPFVRAASTVRAPSALAAF